MFKMRKWFGIIPVFTLAALLISAIATQIPKIEDSIVTSAKKILVSAQQTWANVEASGQELTVSGVAPTQELKDYTLSLLSDVKSVSTVTETITLKPAEKPYILAFSKTGSEIVVDGAVPKRNTKDKIFEALRSTIPNSKINDKTHFASGMGDNANWEPGVNFIIAQLNRMETGTAKIIDGQYEVSGVTTTLEAYDSLQAAFQQLPDGFKVSTNNVAISKPDIYKFDMEKIDTVVNLTGFVPSLVSKQEIVAEIQRQIPNASISDKLRIAQGASSDFAKVVNASISAIKLIPIATFSIANDTLSIKAAPEKYETYESITKAIAALGSEIKINTKDFIQPIKIELQPLKVTFSDNKVEIMGELADADMRNSFINVLQGAKSFTIVDKTSLKPAFVSYNYGEVLRNLLPALKMSKTLSAEFTPAGVNVKIEALDSSAMNLVTQFFTAKQPNIIDVKILSAIQKPFKWSVIKDGASVEITGYVPTTEARTLLLQTLKSSNNNNSLIDTMNLAGTELVYEDWIVTTKSLLQLSAYFKKASIELLDMNLSITARANSVSDLVLANEAITKLPKFITIKSVTIEPAQ